MEKHLRCPRLNYIDKTSLDAICASRGPFPSRRLDATIQATWWNDRKYSAIASSILNRHLEFFLHRSTSANQRVHMNQHRPGLTEYKRRQDLIPLLTALALGLTLLLPKLALGLFATDVLSVHLSSANWAWLFVQDVCFSLAMIALILTLIDRGKGGAIIAGSLLLAVVGFLFVDARVRQLWLQPLDFSLIRYFFSNLDVLVDGAPAFLEGQTLWGWTFRRVVFFIALSTLVFVSILAFMSHRCGSLRTPRLLMLAAALGLLAIALFAPRLPYQLEGHGVLGHALAMVRQQPSDTDTTEGRQLAANFDQPVSTMSHEWKQSRKFLTGMSSFDNVIVVVYESVRWKSTQPPANPDGVAPTLSQLAHEGVAMRAYASVPHSSKSYHAIFTGTYPAPGVEVLEAVVPHLKTIWQDLKIEGLTMAVSSVPLTFENMKGQLRAQGFSHIFSTGQLTHQTVPASSFGGADEYLYAAALDKLATLRRQDVRFALALFPMAAHYPYECTESVKGKRAYPEYLACIAYSEILLNKLIERLRVDPQWANTLLVVVGDHGESFGERGLFIHNSSLYEEEITVPLIFWSKDGRLRSGAWPNRARQIDIAATIADLLGLTNTAAVTQGHSLLRQNAAEPFVSYLATFYDGLSLGLVEGNSKAMLDVATGVVTRYDLKGDPLESQPRSVPEPEAQQFRERLRSFRAYQMAYLVGPAKHLTH